MLTNYWNKSEEKRPDRNFFNSVHINQYRVLLWQSKKEKIMKQYAVKLVVVLAVLGGIATGCKDRNAEKRIAALENEIRELKGTKSAENVGSPIPVEAEASGPAASISFDKIEHDFGTIKEGEVVEYTYTFTNTGEVPLVIQEARPSCGCTAPDWTKTPIPVGGKGFVKASFDSKNKPNVQNKTITVVANTKPQQTVLRFKAMVTPKAQQPDAGPLRQ